MGGAVDMHVRIMVESRDEPGSVGAATEVLRHRLEQLTGGDDGWHAVRPEPRPDAPPAQGPIQDIVLDFVLDDALPAGALATAAYVVRAVYSHFRTQPDPTQRATLLQPGLHLVLTPDMTPEQVAQAEAEFGEWIARHRPGEDEGE